MTKDLIFDIGLHKGEDTAFYLRKGYRVAAFEANPALVQACRERFAEAIETGDLVVFEGLLRARAAGATASFYVNQIHSDWGTAVSAWRDRNQAAFHAPSQEITVPVVSLHSIVRALGIPLYAKIDIEGLDHEILRAFHDFPKRPRFVSVESAKTSFEALEAEIALLADLGYRHFKAVQQRTIPGSRIATFTTAGEPLSYVFERHSSGPFGDDLGLWTDQRGVLEDYRRIFRAYKRWGDNSWLQRRFGRKSIAALQVLARRPLPGWYDTHARVNAPPPP